MVTLPALSASNFLPGTVAAVSPHRLQERNGGWVTQAPLVVSNQVSISASSAQVFGVLADIGNWHAWCTGVTESEVVGPVATGLGAKRTVKAGGVRFEEIFVNWEEGVRVTFSALTTSAPGIRSLVEDWSVAPDVADPSNSLLTQTMAVELSSMLRPLTGALRWYLQRATRRGAQGMARHFA